MFSDSPAGRLHVQRASISRLCPNWQLGSRACGNFVTKVDHAALAGALLHLSERDVVAHKLAQSHVDRRAADKKQFEAVKGFCPKMGQIVE